MDSKKTSPTIFSYKKNQLDNIVGRVPIRKMLYSFFLIISVVVLLGIGASKIEYSCVMQGDLFIEKASEKFLSGRLKLPASSKPIQPKMTLSVGQSQYQLETVSLPDQSETGNVYYDLTFKPNAEHVSPIPLRKQMQVKISDASCRQNFLSHLLGNFF